MAGGQESRVVRVISKQLVKRSIELLKEIKERPAQENKPADYSVFWDSFGKFIKLGVIEDSASRCAFPF